ALPTLALHDASSDLNARGARVFLAGAALAVLLAAFGTSAQDATRAASEQSIKAAYLLKFPTYVEWPASRFEQPASAITFGVLGEPAVADELAVIAAGRTVNGRPIEVRRISSAESLEGLHVLFFSGAGREAERIAASAAEQSILTVGDAPNGNGGSIIGFVTVNGRVRFEVHLPTA